MKKSFESLFATYGTISVPAPLISTDAWPLRPKGSFHRRCSASQRSRPAAALSQPAGRQTNRFNSMDAGRRPPCDILPAQSETPPASFYQRLAGVSDCRKKSGCGGLFRQNGVRKPGCARLANPPHISMDSELVRRARAFRPSQACRSFSRDAPCRRNRWLPCRGHSARR